jgi:hypothetical protein
MAVYARILFTYIFNTDSYIVVSAYNRTISDVSKHTSIEGFIVQKYKVLLHVTNLFVFGVSLFLNWLVFDKKCLIQKGIRKA